jgi:phosphoserine phosphatase
MRWPPYEHVFFDCDSTLTAVEGIDVLAAAAGKGWRIGVLTRAAMDGHLNLEEVYDKRLRALQPTRSQIHAIRQAYKRHVVEDAPAVVHALQRLGHKVYIISGGLAEAVVEFGLYLNIPRDRIRAVGIDYNSLSGDWWRDLGDGYPNGAERYLAYRDQWLTISDGKARIVQELLADQPGRSLLVGDGVSDLLAGRAVDLFVGFGGVARRDRVLAEAPAFIHSASLAPILPLATGPALLGPSGARCADLEPELAQKALQLIATGAITFQDERLNQKFAQAYQAVYPRADGSPA